MKCKAHTSMSFIDLPTSTTATKRLPSSRPTN